MSNNLIAFVLSVALTLVTSTYAQGAHCSPNEIVLEGQKIVDLLDTDSPEIAELPNSQIKILKIKFEDERTINVSGRLRKVIPIRIGFTATADDLPKTYDSIIAENIPKNSCPTRFQKQNVSLEPANLHQLGGRFNVRFQAYACLKTKWVCCKWLSCHTCWLEANTFLYQKTFNYETNLNLDVDPLSGQMNVTGKTKLTNAATEKFVLDLVSFIVTSMAPVELFLADAMSPKKMSKNLSLNFISKMEKRLPRVKQHFNIGKPAKEGAQKLANSVDEQYRFFVQDLADKLVLDPKTTGVTSSAGKMMFQVDMVTPDEKSKLSDTACEIATALNAKLRYAESKNNPVTTHVMTKGESLWNVSQKLYGDGLYYPILLESNNLDEPAAAHLKPGAELAVMPFHELVDSEGSLVEAGDSLWKIAERKLGSGSRWPELFKANSAFKNPNKIMPLQRLILATEGSGQ